MIDRRKCLLNIMDITPTPINPNRIRAWCSCGDWKSDALNELHARQLYRLHTWDVGALDDIYEHTFRELKTQAEYSGSDMILADLISVALSRAKAEWESLP